MDDETADAARQLDAYLLGGPVTKAAAVSGLLAARSSREKATPFYRALEALGTRAADEALVALRLVLAGQEPSDARVRRLRALSRLVCAAGRGDPRAVDELYAAEPEVRRLLLSEGGAAPEDLARLGTEAKKAYENDLGMSQNRSSG